ncbi:MAG: hypothetical protein R3E98_13265 [Gemmatimonadota bacterium]
MDRAALRARSDAGLTGIQGHAARLLLLLHLVLGAAGPLAEARLEAREAPRAHLEVEGDPTCAPAHNHFLCVVGRTMALHLPGLAPQEPLAPESRARLLGAPAAAPAYADPAPLHGARAPPHA